MPCQDVEPEAHGEDRSEAIVGITVVLNDAKAWVARCCYRCIASTSDLSRVERERKNAIDQEHDYKNRCQGNHECITMSKESQEYSDVARVEGGGKRSRAK